MPSEVQSVYFMNNVWNTKSARKWLNNHDFYPIKKVQHYGNQIRYRLKPPELYSKFATLPLGNDVYLVLGIY